MNEMIRNFIKNKDYGNNVVDLKEYLQITHTHSNPHESSNYYGLIKALENQKKSNTKLKSNTN